MKTAEIVVIGGGVNGSSIAYRLARQGVRNVVQLEQRQIASGPTGRSSGVVRQHYTIETLAAMARDSIRAFQNFPEEIGGDAGFVQCGVAWCCPAGSAETIEQIIAMHHRLGIRETLLTGDDIKKMDPEIFTEDIAYAGYEPDGGYADPALTANSFADAARDLGVEVLTGKLVTGITLEEGRVAGVKTESGEISTRTVVNVAGPWGAHIAAMVGAQIPICATRHPVVILERPEKWRSHTPVIGDLVNGWYFKPEKNGGLMVGSITDMAAAHSIDMDADSAEPSFEEVEQYAHAAVGRFPVMTDGKAAGGWAGLYDLTPDSQPVIDRIPGVEGFFCAVGFSGHGFKIGPAVGVAMTELIVDGHSTTYDLTPFRYSRFAEGKLTHGSYSYSIIG